ncbi:syntaxin Pep12p [[Candida] railenensis]|uniref:Syntaxin Pep12p n=1 Tax=[Candida] railenensis TaxID=45579 RepID=A0A9P0QLX5_9ASCO|nr:syntaxin Pep12p [[Candida] railenensis]
MSFNDLEAAESPRYVDFPEFEGYSQAIENNLYNINNNQIPALKKLLTQYDQLLAELDTFDLDKIQKISTKMSGLVTKTTSSFKNVNDSATKLNQYLNECASNHEDDDTLEYLRQKETILISLIKSSINQFSKQQKKIEAVEKEVKKRQESSVAASEHPGSASASDGAIGSGTAGSDQVQQSIQIDYEPVNAEELEEQSLLIQEREREIHQISQDITEINDIFSNLHELVTEQQTTIDSIEDNILQYSDDARGATVELRRAERYQKRNSGRMMCCLAILLGVLGMIIFIGVVL